MMHIRDTASCIARLILTVILIVATLGPAIAPIGDRGAGGSHYASAVPSHDCCDTESALPDARCRFGCLQAPCGSTALADLVSAILPVDPHVVAWLFTISLPDGIAPEIATPPPRA
jgi:hypothetical protein